MTVDSMYRGRRSMLGTQPSSAFPSAPSYGFGTAERAQLNAKLFVSKDMVSDKERGPTFIFLSIFVFIWSFWVLQFEDYEPPSAPLAPSMPPSTSPTLSPANSP